MEGTSPEFELPSRKPVFATSDSNGPWYLKMYSPLRRSTAYTSPFWMIGNDHITTLSRPLDSAGSSWETYGSGSGTYSAAPVGCSGSLVSMTCSPVECHVTKARWRVSVGLCEEKLATFSRSAGTSAQVLGSLTGSLYSEATRGLVASLMSMKRTHPHGHPCAGSSPPSWP